MKLIHLHVINNPQQTVVVDAEDFSLAAPFGVGSSLWLKSFSAPFAVNETPDEIETIIAGA